mgnify:CR=1 FL=1|tara:strand:+ start:1248 stop:1547 length:300 start_codon:yes stop_codon:yes gene_type:complete
MKTFVQSGQVLTLVAAAAATAGEPVIVGQLVGVALEDAAIGDEVVIHTSGVFNMPAADSLSVGAAVEWDSGELVALDAGVQVGVLVTASAGGFAQVKVG